MMSGSCSGLNRDIFNLNREQVVLKIVEQTEYRFRLSCQG